MVDVGPAAFVEGIGAAVHAIDHRGGGAGLDEARHPGIAGEAQGAQRAFARGDDEILLVPGRLRGDRRGDVGDMGAARHSLGPAGIAHQFGCEELELLRRGIGEPCAQTRLALGDIADSAVHRPALGQQLPDQLSGDVAGRPRHQNRSCHATLPCFAR